MSSHLALKTVLILISWLLQKPADLNLDCLQEKPAYQNPYCLQELIYIWFHTVLERINCLSTVRYKLICSFGQVTLSMDKYILAFTCPWTRRKYYYFHTSASPLPPRSFWLLDICMTTCTLETVFLKYSTIWGGVL